ncbi:MAG: FG-GAP-like repeat-containing protein [Acidobacteriota bacterium]
MRRATHHPSHTRRRFARTVGVVPIILFVGALVSLLLARPSHAATPPGLVPADTAIGTLEGTFSVDGNGAATYQIALEVPPGTNGVAPKLGLTYSSHRDNGMLGMGWALNGVSNISRCNATDAVNGFTAAVSFSDLDRFCLDGQPLLAVDGDYGRDGTEYRTRRDNWTRIVSHGTCGVGPCWFSAQNKDGATLSFGETTGATGSRVLATGRSDGAVRVWSLDRYTDLNGNYTEISYDNDTTFGTYKPSAIAYTGNERTGLQPQRSVRFVYQRRSDRISGYVGGSGYQTLDRLTRIETRVGEQLVKSYSLDYDYGANTGRSRLRSIRDCTTETPTDATCLPPTRFDMSDPARGFSNGPGRGTGVAVSQTIGILPMDANGDARTDVVQAWSDSGTLHLETFLSNGTSLGSGSDQNIGVEVGGFGVIGMDVDGNGLGDVVMPVERSGTLDLRAILSDGDGSFGSDVNTRTGEPVDHLAFVPADVDADGRQDLVQVYASSGTVAFRVYPATGGGSFGGAQPSGSAQSTENHGFLPIDFNGDGRIDIVQPRSDSSDNLVFVLYRSNGRAFDGGTVVQTGRAPSELTVTAGDVNGDGKTDLVLLDLSSTDAEATPFFSTGTTFRNGSSTTLGKTDGNVAILSAQLDSDARSDLMQVIESGSRLQLLPFYGTGDRFTAGTPFESSLPVETIGLQMLDLDGDNRQDLLDPRAVSGAVELSLVLSNSGQPDLLTRATNGLDGEVRVTHRPMSDSAVYERGRSAVYPIREVTSPMPVVSSYVNTDGRGSEYRFDYFYRQGRAGAGGIGWLGFATIRLTQPTDGRFSEVTYEQTWPANGLVIKNAFYNHNQVILGSTEMGFDDVAPSALQALGIHQFVPVSERYASFDERSGGARLYTLETQYAYDDHGSVALIAYLGQPGRNDDDRFTCMRYAHDPTSWQLGYLSEQKVTRTRAACDTFLATQSPTWNPATDVRWERWAYDARKNLTDKSIWDDSHDSWLSTGATVDDYGNMLSRIDPAGNATTFTYDDTYHTFVRTMSSPPTASGLVLVDTYTHEPYFGSEIEHTDPNDNIWRWQIDTLGREVTTQSPAPSGTTVTVALTEWGQDSNGYYTRQRSRPSWTSADDPANWHWQKSYLDGMFREYRTETRGETDATDVVNSVRFNANGEIEGESIPYFASQQPSWVETRYDVYNRPVTTTQPDGTIQKLDYQLGTLKVYQTDAWDTPDARTDIRQYNAFGREIGRTMSNGEVYYYRYSLTGELVEIRTLPTRRTVLFAYDSVGRLRSHTTTDSGTTHYHFDDRGRMTGEIDADGNELTYTYDNLGRILTAVGNAASGSDLTYTYTYDGDTLNGKGELTKVVMSDSLVGDVTFHLGYDAAGQTETVRLEAAGATYSYGMTYNPLGQLEEQIYPNGAVLRVAYGKDSQADTFDLALDGRTFETYVRYADYDPYGVPTTQTFKNGVETVHTYYPPDVETGKLERITSRSTTTDTTLYDARISWNRLSFVTEVEDLLRPSYTEAYGYDPAKMGFLTDATGVFGEESYGYDQVGNRTEHNGVAYTYPEPNDLFTAFGPGTSASWNDNGTLRTFDDGSGALTFGYDAWGRIADATRQGTDGAGHALYDFTGNRLLHQPIGTTTRYWAVASDYHVAEYEDGRRVATTYIDGLFGRAVAITNELADDSVALAHHNHEMAARLYAYAPLRSLGHQVAALLSTPALHHWITRGGPQLVVALLLLFVGWWAVGRRRPTHRVPWRVGSLRRHPVFARMVPVVLAVFFLYSVPAAAELQPGANGAGNPTPGIAYFVQDMVGSTVSVTDATGSETANLEYLPYGAVDIGNSQGTDNFRPKFSGKEIDYDTGLYDFDRRYYQADVGRFVTPDPMYQYINPYVLGSDNPVSMVDPTGEFAFLIAAIVVGAVIGAYMGAAAVNHDYNPAHWDWKSGKTYAGLLGGAVIGGIGGAIVEVAATAGVAAGIAGAVLVGAGENAAYTAMGGGSAKDILISAGEGAAFGFLFGAAGAALGRLASRAGRSATRAIGEGAEAAESGAAKGLRSVCSSFLGGTEVLGVDGDGIAIDQLAVGDTVIGWSHDTDRSGAHPVLATLDGETTDVTRITTASGAVIEATPSHLMRVHTMGWMRADQLHTGLALTDPDGRPIALADVATTTLEQPVAVHNLSVDHATSYYVSADRALAKNVKGSCLVAKGKRRPGWRSSVKDQVFKRQTAKSGANKGKIRSAASGKYYSRSAKVMIGKKKPRYRTLWDLDHEIPYKYLLWAAENTKVKVTWKNMIDVSNYAPNLRYMTMSENVSHAFEPTQAAGRAGAIKVFKALKLWK